MGGTRDPIPGIGRRPMLLAVEPDPDALDRLETELQRGFGADFKIRGELGVDDALRVVEGAHERGDRVALVLVSRSFDRAARSTLFRTTRNLHADARRALLVEWGSWADREAAHAILTAMATGDVNYYVLKPWIERDELFRRTVAEFVQEWSRSDVSNPREVMLVADQASLRGGQVRRLLERNGVPHAFWARGSRLATTVEQHVLHEGLDLDGVDVLVWMPALGGRVLLDPSDAEVAEAWGIPTTLDGARRDFDVVVVGTGPAGLAAAVYASSEGLRVLAVERDAIGGQAGSSSLIRNFLGFSRGISGAELAQRGYQQAWVFGAHFLLTHEAQSLGRDDDWFALTVADVGQVRARAVVLATGVSYRRLGIPSVEALMGAGVHYGASVSEAHALTGLHGTVVGGGNSAGQAALHLARYCEHVTLVVRSSSLEVGMSQYLVDAIAAAENVHPCTDTEVSDAGGDGRLSWVTLRNRSAGAQERIRSDGLFVMIGAEPRTGWLPEAVRRDRFGFVLAGSDAAESGTWPLARGPHPYESTMPGLFAVGDVRSGSVKRVASAVGEGSVVMSQVHEYLADLSEKAASGRV